MASVPRKTMVCVTVQKNCERLIRHGAKEAGDKELWVVHVVKNGHPVLGGNDEGQALEYLFGISRAYGAQMDMLRSDDVIGTIVDFAIKNGVECLVIGSATRHSKMDVGSLLREKLQGVQIIIIP